MGSPSRGGGGNSCDDGAPKQQDDDSSVEFQIVVFIQEQLDKRLKVARQQGDVVDVDTESDDDCEIFSPMKKKAPVRAASVAAAPK